MDAGRSMSDVIITCFLQCSRSVNYVPPISLIQVTMLFSRQMTRLTITRQWYVSVIVITEIILFNKFIFLCF